MLKLANFFSGKRSRWEIQRWKAPCKIACSRAQQPRNLAAQELIS
jgi:hypothetical protein